MIRQASASRPPAASARATTKTTTRTLSNVAAGVAHDLANLLVVIGIDLDLLASELLSPPGVDAIRSLRAQTSYLRDLARDLRMATVKSEVRDANPRTDLAAWWSATAVLLLAVHGDDIVMRSDISPNLPPVCIEPHDLTQVVLNLVGNAAHAIADRRGPDDHRRGEIRLAARLAGHGLGVILTVADNGPGMSPAVLARACEPFFTTRAGRGGTGLGLLMVQRLVGDVGGKVHLSSVADVGTTVTVELATSPCRGALSGDPARS